MEKDEMEKRELEFQEDIYVMDDGILKIREIKIIKSLPCNTWAKPSKQPCYVHTRTNALALSYTHHLQST